MSGPTSKYLTVDGLRTHYLEAGEGPTLVLIHSGEFGASAELSWELLLPLLSLRFRVLAPDMLGYGDSAKVHDFESGYGRRTSHLASFLAALDVQDAHFAGTSMGGTLLFRDLTSKQGSFRPRSATLMSSGGAMLDNEDRRRLLDYDCTVEGMRGIVSILFHASRWAEDDEYVQRRFESSLTPGAWECSAAARLKNPTLPPRSEFGHPDRLDYEAIEVPVLLIAGANDPLKTPGYADEVARRIPSCQLAVLDDCAHSPNLEHPEAVADLISAFVTRHEGA